MSSASKIIQAAAGNAGEALYVEDVFSTYLYEGNDTARDITNGVNLEEEGGLVWTKARNATAVHALYDTERGTNKAVFSHLTNAESDFGSGTLTAFNSDGFSLGTLGISNDSAENYASWTFRKAPKFFDVVTWTGDGNSGKTISHNLGVAPGCVIIKRTDSTSNWTFWHRSLTAENFLRLNLTDAEVNAAFFEAVSGQGNVNPTDSVITLGNSTQVNANNGTYVAYLFAHNDGDGEFGEDGDQDIIKCGSYSGSNQTIDLGFEPQFIIVKRTDATENWMMFDSMRGWNADGDSLGWLIPNASNAESTLTNGQFELRSDGFFTGSGYSPLNGGSNYIYIAIRRGPMKTPESGTEVFAPAKTTTQNAFVTTGFPVDLNIFKTLDAVQSAYWAPRITKRSLLSASTAAESAVFVSFDYSTGIQTQSASGVNYAVYNFLRAPGFFDVVAYAGTGSLTSVNHNLGVTPELIIVKNRSASTAWQVVGSALGGANSRDNFMTLNTTDSLTTFSNYRNADDTSTTFGVKTNNNNFDSSGQNFIAYLFATLPGVSKVGSYTGNGTSQTIDCGFSTGARFVMTKRTNTTGNWNVWDSERGIVAGNDSRIEFNTTDSEDTGHDYIDPDSSGFVVNYVADDDDDSNVSGDTYIFLAIA